MKAEDPHSSTNVPGGFRRGRILRLKQGYNPNSSSMGSIVFALPVALLGASALFGAAAAAVFAGLLKRGTPAGHGDKSDGSRAAGGQGKEL